jgi:hypothetical protein
MKIIKPTTDFIKDLLCYFRRCLLKFTWWHWTIRLGVAALYFVSGYLKMLDPVTTFAELIDAFRIVPDWAVYAIAVVLPPFEIFVALMLFSKFWKCALQIIAGMSFVFLGALLQTIFRGINLEDCGCFGSFGSDVQTGIWKNIAALIGISFIIFHHPDRVRRQKQK